MTSSSGPVASALSSWLADPDVIADPYQLHGTRVWAHASDILEGALAGDGATVMAAWGDVTWSARVEWDPQALDWLWLEPVELSEVPRVEQIHPSTVDPVVLLQDLHDTIEVVVELSARRRRLARQVLDDLGPRGARALPESTLLMLLRAARIPCADRPDGQAPVHS